MTLYSSWVSLVFSVSKNNQAEFLKMFCIKQQEACFIYLNLTCWHAAGVKKKEKLHNVLFIHSFSFPSVCQCLFRESNLSDKIMWKGVVSFQIFFRELHPNNVSSASLRDFRFSDAHSKVKVQADQLTQLPSLFTSLAGGMGAVECLYTRRAWEKCSQCQS